MSLKSEIKELSRRIERLPSPNFQQPYGFNEWLPIANPRLRWDWLHFRYIVEYLEHLTLGEIKRLMLFLPPRHAKTTLVTIQYVAWTLIGDPKKKSLSELTIKNQPHGSQDTFVELLPAGFPSMKKELQHLIGKLLQEVE